jgi:hypothetical protein
MTQDLSLVIEAGAPTLAVIVMSIRREFVLARIKAGLPAEASPAARIEKLERDLQALTRTAMQHHADIARLKEEAGLAD